MNLNTLPVFNKEYLNKIYWDDRYKNEETFEWFHGYKNDTFRTVISETIKPTDKILMMGCGNSPLSEEMYNDGFHNIVNMDYSSVVIENMQKKCAHCHKMVWLTMDMNEMSFEPASFDVILEKGTLDVILTSETSPWDVTKSTEDKFHNIISQISTFLKPGGRFLSITFAQPHFRKRLYAKSEYKWSLAHLQFGETFHYFIYMMTKGMELSESDRRLEEEWRTRKMRKQEDIVYLSDNDDEDFLLKMLT